MMTIAVYREGDNAGSGPGPARHDNERRTKSPMDEGQDTKKEGLTPDPVLHMSSVIRASVSAVIPCYRCQDTIERAVASVVAQTWRPAELILVDDASDDNTPEVLYALQERYGANWVRVVCLTQNSGPAVARNAGWDMSAQPYIAFLDADDSWHPRKVEIQGKYMLDHPDADFCAHRLRVTTDCPDSFPEAAPEEPVASPDVVPLTSRRLLWRNAAVTSTVMLRTCLPVRFPEKRYSEDYYLWLRLVLGGWKGVVLNAELAFSHKSVYGASGLSGRLWRMQRGELETYHRLVREGLLPARDLLWLVPWSLAKFLRRVVVARVVRPLRPQRGPGVP